MKSLSEVLNEQLFEALKPSELKRGAEYTITPKWLSSPTLCKYRGSVSGKFIFQPIGTTIEIALDNLNDVSYTKIQK